MNGGKVYIVREEREDEVMSVYVGDSVYWRNGDIPNEEHVDKEQESTVASVEQMLDDTDHLDTKYPAVQSVVEE